MEDIEPWKKMADDIINEINNLKDSEESISHLDAMKGFYNGLKKYLEDHMEINFNWTAAMLNPPYTTDTVTSYNAKINILTNVLENSYKSTTSEALFNFQGQLQIQLSNILNAVIKPETYEPPFNVTPTNLFANNSIILNQNTNAREQIVAMESICKDITDGLKMMINQIPVTGTHGNFTGSGTMNSISFQL